MVAPFYIYRHYFVRYDFGTIGGRSAENLLFISAFRVGEEFDSHHPLYFFAREAFEIKSFLFYYYKSCYDCIKQMILPIYIIEQVDPGSRNGGAYAGRWNWKRT